MCNDLNTPQPVYEKPCNNYLSYLKTCAVENCGHSLRVAAHELRKLKLEGDEDVNQALDVPVSVDVAWQKRFIFVTSLDTGYVLGYVVKT